MVAKGYTEQITMIFIKLLRISEENARKYLNIAETVLLKFFREIVSEIFSLGRYSIHWRECLSSRKNVINQGMRKCNIEKILNRRIVLTRFSDFYF